MKNRQALIVALIMGFISIIMLFAYVKKVKSEATKGMELVKVLVAKEDLAGGTLLKTSNLLYRKYPAKYVEGRAISPDESSLVLGKRLKWGVQKKRPILWSDIEMVEEREVSSLIEKGMRAVTVPVSKVSGVGGLVEPGMSVDLLYIFNVNSLLPKRKRTVSKDNDSIKSIREMMMAKALDKAENEKGIMTLAQNVKVMAVDNRTSYSLADSNNKQNSYSTVTLMVDPKLAQIILYAQENGKLIFSLKNKSDVSEVKGERIVTAEDIIGLIGDAYEEIKRRELEVFDVTK